MGRKRGRKRERRAAQRAGQGRWDSPSFDFEPDPFGEDAFLALMPDRHRDDMVAVKACGSCVDFIEDGEGGRGTCLHPASGILSPWTDTEACSYWRRR